MAKDARGHGSEGRGGSVTEQHQLNIARKTVKMPAAMAAIMGGMTPAQAHALIQQRGSLADKAMAAEYAKIPDSSSLASGPKSAPVDTHPAMNNYERLKAAGVPMEDLTHAPGMRGVNTPRTAAERFHGSIESQIARGQYKP